MNPKISSILKTILSASAFYVIFAVGCVLSEGGSTGVLVSSFSEICAAFGGICVINYLSKRFDRPDEAESEVSAELPDVKRQKATPTKLLLTLGLSIVCAVALFCVNLLYSRFVYGNSEAPQVSFGVGVVLLGLLVPVAEEIFFRGCLINHMISDGVSPGVSILISSAVFALIHDVRVMPFAFISGIFLGLCSQVIGGKFGTAASVTAHSLYNTALCILAAIQTA